MGETFAGVPFEVGVAAAREVASLTPAGCHDRAARPALGRRPARRVRGDPRRAHRGAGRRERAAAALPPVDEETLDGLRGVYDGRIRAHVHARW